MANQNSNSENQQRPFSQEQYDMLKRCSDKKDASEWNQWREKHPNEEIRLQGSDFKGWWLQGANFMHGSTRKNNTYINFGKVHLEDANFEWANLRNSVFAGAEMNGAKFWSANAEDAEFVGTHLESADLSVAHFDNSDFSGAFLKNAKIISSHINGANFAHADIQGCSARSAIVDGETNLAYCQVNRFSIQKLFTDFNNVALSSIRIDPGTEQLLEYNIRRMNWEEWYKNHWLLKWPVRLFWCFSDYGINTWRIIGWFFGLAVVFAGIYYIWALANPPGIVHGLINGQEGLVPVWLLPFRSIYFSIVTMTTLGFGDMHANCQSFWGHLLITFQVLLGYVLLGALVTRFAVLFTAGGPAGKFADTSIEK
jgi:Ion channel/Pentapeptide repeats (8 copies)